MSARMDELEERLNPPNDWNDPEWKKYDRVHNWRNYASQELEDGWSDLPESLKIILSANFNEMASNEEWD